MAEQPQKKVRKFTPKKQAGTIVSAHKKKKRVPVPKTLNTQPQSAPQPPPPAQPAPPVQPQPPVPAVQPQAPIQMQPQPIPMQPAPVPVPQPQPVQMQQPPVPVQPQTPMQMQQPPAPVPMPQTPIQMQQSAPQQQPLPPPIVPQTQPPVQVPPPAGVVDMGQPTSINVPTHTSSPVKGRTGAHKKAAQKKVLKGKQAMQTEAEDIKDAVASYMEVCDSLLSENNSSQDIIDVVHMLVRSLNLDVVTIALLDPARETLQIRIASRGYKTPPNCDVVSCWEKAITKGEGIDWKTLMNVASDNHTELAYWIVQEGLDSIGYVPIRDNRRIYGILFVAATSKHKKQSPVASHLLDACGSRIGTVYALENATVTWPEKVLDLAHGIREQSALIMGYMEMLGNKGLPDEEIESIITTCKTTIQKTIHMLDTMTSEATGE